MKQKKIRKYLLPVRCIFTQICKWQSILICNIFDKKILLYILPSVILIWKDGPIYRTFLLGPLTRDKMSQSLFNVQSARIIVRPMLFMKRQLNWYQRRMDVFQIKINPWYINQSFHKINYYHWAYQDEFVPIKRIFILS